MFNLVNNVDVDETKARIEQFRQSNEALITRNQTLESIERRQFGTVPFVKSVCVRVCVCVCSPSDVPGSRNRRAGKKGARGTG